MLSVLFTLGGGMFLGPNVKISSFILLCLLFIFLFHSRGEGWVLLGNGMGGDTLSNLLMILTLFVGYCMYMSSNSIWEDLDNSTAYFFLLLFMIFVLYMNYYSVNLLIFFIWFEVILIPLFFLVMGWGNQYERFGAGLYLIFYTLFGSMPLLLALVFFSKDNSLSMIMLDKGGGMEDLWKGAFLGAFLMSLPMYLLHYWLPSAHVEAPVSGSMLLAGVLLKLGGYGLYRVYMFLMLGSWESYLISLGLLGGLYSSCLCFRQVDVKSLVAYSSVGHMGLFLSGVLTGSVLGYQGGMILMVGHGFCSSGLFCLMNFYYERIGSRNLLMLSGFMSLSPSLMFWSFLMLSSNMSAPPSLNLVGELHLFASLWNYHNSSCLLLFFLFMLGGGYSLYMYSLLGHGTFWLNGGFKPLNLREYLLMLFHWLPLNISFMFLGSF